MRLLRFLVFVSTLFFIVACSGEMDGRVRGTGESIVFNYEQGLDRDFYTASIGDESFKGQAVDAGASTGVGTVLGATGAATGVFSTTTGSFVATLFGDKGSTMRCQMNYADSSGFTSIGGVGVCYHSDGRIVDVMW